MLISGADVVRAVHFAFVAWVVMAPWWGKWEVTLLHAIAVPFLWLHWALNDDTCFLTWLESTLRGVPVTSSFLHQIISPIYKVHAQGTSQAAWLATLALWGASLHRLSTRHAGQVGRAYSLLTSHFR